MRKTLVTIIAVAVVLSGCSDGNLPAGGNAVAEDATTTTTTVRPWVADPDSPDAAAAYVSYKGGCENALRVASRSGAIAPSLDVLETHCGKKATDRPLWCSHYDDWKRASDTVDDIASRHGSNVTRWPDGVYEQWERSFNHQMRAADILWDGTEAGSVPRGWDARARACR